MSLPYTAIYKQDGDWIMGQLLEVPGVLTQGRTVEECRDNLKDAFAEFVCAQLGIPGIRRQGK